MKKLLLLWVYVGLAKAQTCVYFPTYPPCTQPASSSVSLSSTANPSTLGQSVTLTATIKVSGVGIYANSPNPTGSVTFFDGTAQLGSGSVSIDSTVVLTTRLLPGGLQNITAQYSGDTVYPGSTGAFTQIVNAPVTMTVTASP